MGALENMQARSVELAGPVEDGGGEALAAEQTLAEGAAGSLEGAADGALTTTPPAAEATPEEAARKARVALLEEKLVASREKRQAQRLEERARAERRAAKSEREAAAAERAKYDGLKKGSFKDTITALGHDPAKVFAEMQREAVEASTPEAVARKEQERIDAALKAQQDEIEKLRSERDQERAQAAAQQHQQRLMASFQRDLQDPAFNELRIEYPDEALLDHAQYYDKNPRELFTHAQTYGVRLTQPEKGFTMHELLQVLSAAQAAHNAAKQARLAARSPAPAEAGRTPTVNGTAERRNAGTVTNELASTRASSGPVESGSARDRIRARVEQESSRHR